MAIAVVLEVGVRVFVPDAVFSPFQPLYRSDEITGYTMRRGFDGHALGASLRTNSLGFRGDEWARRTSGEALRVALIGDSHAFGFGVEFDESVGECLSREIASRTGKPCEVLNFALPGYNARQQLAALRGYALGFSPDLVVVIPCENDHDPAPGCDADGWLHFSGTGEPGESIRGATNRLVIEKSVLRHSRLAMYLKWMWRRASLGRELRERARPDPRWMQSPVDATVAPHLVSTVFEPLVEMVVVCRENDLPVAVASLAGLPDYRNMFRALNERTRVPILELMSLYPEVSGWSELSARHGLGWDSHLDAASHAKWAVAIAELLDARGLLR